MLIGEVSKKYGIGIETLRYYDKIGLLRVKRKNHKRYYTKEDIKKLNYILALKELLFSLEDIKRILEVDERVDNGLINGSVNKDDIKILCDEIKIKYDEILEREKKLISVKRHLEEILEKVEELKEDNKID